MNDVTKFFESIRGSEVSTLKNQIKNGLIDPEEGKRKLLEIKKKIEDTEAFKSDDDAEFMKTAKSILHQIDEILT